MTAGLWPALMTADFQSADFKLKMLDWQNLSSIDDHLRFERAGENYKDFYLGKLPEIESRLKAIRSH